jgi:hypothetical protein
MALPKLVVSALGSWAEVAGKDRRPKASSRPMLGIFAEPGLVGLEMCTKSDSQKPLTPEFKYDKTSL